MDRWPVILGIWVVVVSFSSRALLPGVRGAVVGISGAIDDADWVLSIASFLTAYYLLATALLATFRVVRTRMPISLRVVVILLAAMLFFNGLGSMVSSRAPISVIA